MHSFKVAMDILKFNIQIKSILNHLNGSENIPESKNTKNQLIIVNNSNQI